MTVTEAVVVATDDDPLGASVVDVLVARVHAEYGGDRGELHRLAVAVLHTFATAPVQAFVPILVEKRLRAFCRAVRAEDTQAASGHPR